MSALGQTRIGARRRGLLGAAARRNLIGYAFLAPYLTLFVVFVIAPVLAATYLSGTYFNMLEPARWVGWSNYRLLALDDDVFVTALTNTVIFATITGPVSYIAAFLLAWQVNRMPVKTPFTLAFYTPSITSAIAMAVIWRYFFSSDRYGLLNAWLTDWGIAAEPVPWLQEQSTILPVIMFVSLWMSLGTSFLVFLAGLQTVPQELYEAARVDGIAGPRQEIWHVTLPMMRPQLLFGAVMTIVASFSVFQVAIQLAGLPSPLYAGHTIVAHLYDYAFIRFEMGYASSIAVVLFVFTFLLGRAAMRAFADD
jgi:multiple sugar transport system permease protein